MAPHPTTTLTKRLNMTKPKTMTLGELRAKLAYSADLPDDTKIFFGAGDLSLYRLKNRGGDGEDLIQFEFNELYRVVLDPDAPD